METTISKAGETLKKPYVAYYRVSTVKQGTSGLGLEAQRQAVKTYLAANDQELVCEYTEIESGKKTDRPELERALIYCKKQKATLLIAKLDRLARNVHFISGLMETGVNFIALDMPNADRFMLHVYAAMAEEEARRISQRTKAALASAKVRGKILGQNGTRLAKRFVLEADVRAKVYGDYISSNYPPNKFSVRQIARSMNEIKNAHLLKKWHPTTVQRILNRHREITIKNTI